MNAVYDLLVGFLRLVTRVFFRSVEVSGREHVPHDGPVIFVGNHPNSLLDPVLITTTCGRRVRFAAKETLFSTPLRPFLAVLGAVPIRRRQDQVAGAKEDGPVVGAPERVDNSEAFDALHRVLDAGEAFGIFPEGISHTRPELAPLKSGAARIALSATEKGIDVVIVPSGLSYRKRDRMRSRVLVQFGQPIVLDQHWRALWAEDQQRASKALTAEINLALRAQTINAKDFETLRVLEGVRKLYKPEHVQLTLAEQAELLRRFIEHWERLSNEPELKAFYDDVAAYQAELRALSLTDGDLRGDLSFINRALRVLRHAVFLFVLVPLAVPGVLLHLPVLVTAVLAGKTLTGRGDVRATIQVCVVTLLTLLAYAAIALSILWQVPPPENVGAALSTLASLLLSGYATLQVLDRQVEIRRGLWTMLSLLHLDRELVRLAAVRESLRSRLLALVDKYKAPDLPRIIAEGEHTDARPWLDDDDVD